MLMVGWRTGDSNDDGGRGVKSLEASFIARATVRTLSLLRFFTPHLTMKRATGARQSRPHALFHLQRSASFICSHKCGHVSEASQPRAWRRKITTPPGKENFHRVSDAAPIEEELLPGYRANDYYPVTTDQTLDSRYRIVCILGRGVGSTVWLAKDVKYDSPESLSNAHHIMGSSR
jgi:hypothetical protein